VPFDYLKDILVKRLIGIHLHWFQKNHLLWLKEGIQKRLYSSMWVQTTFVKIP
jgi:hypothetical protein